MEQRERGKREDSDPWRKERKGWRKMKLIRGMDIKRQREKEIMREGRE